MIFLDQSLELASEGRHVSTNSEVSCFYIVYIYFHTSVKMNSPSIHYWGATLLLLQFRVLFCSLTSGRC